MVSERNFSLKLFKNLISRSQEPKTQEFPRARSGHRMVADNNFVYVLGGYNPAEEIVGGIRQRHSPLLRDLWRYNILTKKWKQIKMEGRLPKELASHNLLLMDNYLIVFGGTDVPFGARNGKEVKIFNLDTQTWEILETYGNKPLPCYGQGVSIYKDKMVVHGGTSGTEYFFHTHILDLSTREWRQLYRHIPTRYPSAGSYRHEIAIWNDKVYCFGGGTDVDIYPMEKLLMFDLTILEDNIWQEVPTIPDPLAGFPQARIFHGLAQRGSSVYVSGGKTMEEPLDDIWHIDMATLTWRKLSMTLPQPVYFHSMAVNKNGKLFTFGGVSLVTNSQVERVNDFSMFWVTVPPLLTLALDALVHYIPQLGSASTARHLGLPYPLFERFA